MPQVVHMGGMVQMYLEDWEVLEELLQLHLTFQELMVIMVPLDPSVGMVVLAGTAVLAVLDMNLLEAIIAADLFLVVVVVVLMQIVGVVLNLLEPLAK